MRVAFTYTDANSPAVATVNNVKIIEEISEAGIEKIQVTTTSNQVYKMTKSQGQIAVLWE